MRHISLAVPLRCRSRRRSSSRVGNAAPADHSFDSDLSNGQLFINRPTGLFQYFIQVGAYSLPDLGVPYLRADTATKAFYGPFSQGFVKIAPTDHFSIEAGKLPTLIGAEYTFSFENMNIERGLLWNQENAVNRGVQINYSSGPLAFAVSWNDGMYSNHLNWAWFSGTWAIDKSNRTCSTPTCRGSQKSGRSRAPRPTGRRFS